MKKTITAALLLAALAAASGNPLRGEENPAGFDSLAEKLKTASGAERQRAIEQLVATGKDCLPRINATLLEEDEEMRRKISLLIEQLGHEEWEKREAAHSRLVEIGLRAVPQVTEGARHNDREIAYRCMQIKIKIESQSAEETAKRRKLFTALLFAAKSLSDRSSLDAMHRCCRDAEKDIRIAAADAVSALADPSSAATLAELLRDRDIHVHLLAGSGLARIRSEDARALVTSMLLNADENVYLRRLAAVALKNYGDRKAIVELIPLLNDRSYVVRCAALDALQALGGLGGETFGCDWRGDSEAARAAREAAVAEWKEWWRKESEKAGGN